MSLQATASAAKQVYDLLVQIQVLLNQMQITTTGKGGGVSQIKEAEISIMQIRRAMFDIVYLARQAGLGEDLTAIMGKGAQVAQGAMSLATSIAVLLPLLATPMSPLVLAAIGLQTLAVASRAVYLGESVSSGFGTSSIGERVRMFG